MTDKPPRLAWNKSKDESGNTCWTAEAPWLLEVRQELRDDRIVWVPVAHPPSEPGPARDALDDAFDWLQSVYNAIPKQTT